MLCVLKASVDVEQGRRNNDDKKNERENLICLWMTLLMIWCFLFFPSGFPAVTLKQWMDVGHNGWTNDNGNGDYMTMTTMMIQLMRKRHIGNDIVTIVFQEPGALPFTPKNIRSQFQHVFIIVRVINPCTENTCYRWAQIAFAAPLCCSKFLYCMQR